MTKPATAFSATTYRNASASIYVAVGLGFLLVISVFYGLSSRPLSQAIEQMNREHLEETLNFSVWGINNILDKYVSLARQIASRTAIRKRQAAYLAGEIDRQAFLDFSRPKLRDAIRTSTNTDDDSDVRGIARLAPDGALLYQVGELVDPDPWRVACTKQREGVSLLGVSEQAGDWVFLYCSVVEYPPQGLIGRDLVAIDGVDLIRFLERFSNAAMAFAFSDDSGRMLFDGNPSATPAAMAALRAVLDRWQTGLATPPGAPAAMEFAHYAVRVNSTSLPGLTLYAVIDTDLARAAVTEQRLRLAIALPFTLVLVAALVLLGLRPLLRRLAEQSELAKSLSERKALEEALSQSEERLRRAQAFANIGTWDWTIDTDELFWSERVAPMLGYPPDWRQVCYQDFLDAVHPGDRALVEAAVSDCLEQGTDYDIEHRVLLPDGRVRWLSEKGNAVRDAQGRAINLLGVAQDITRRKEAEEQLRQFRQVIEESERGVSMATPDGRLFYVNVAHERILAADRLELIGRHYPDFHPDMSRADLARVRRTIMTAGSWRGLLPARDGRGRAFPMQCTIGTLKDERGQVQVIFNVMQDYSIEIQRREELRAAKEAAEQANKAKSEFLSQMSHELRTPLNAVIGFAQLLQTSDQEPLSESQAEQVDYIQRGGEHLLTLIDDILDFVKADAGRISVSLEPVRLDSVLDESLSMLQPMAARFDVTLECAPVPERAGVQADALRLKQVLVNLLSNAIKYNRRGGQVLIRVQPPEPDADPQALCRISVRDTGLGLSQEQCASLFQPFERLGAEARVIEGTGIGLVLTRQLVQAMGGAIGVTSEPGHGSTFWVDMPVAPMPYPTVSTKG